mmetsp:Transcript_31722/g.87611  ORF Transcript_31722/g.87611 Transcript_31722/m.87611 type:complete len:587 (-) Transcript_31722:189-1949(-)
MGAEKRKREPSATLAKARAAQRSARLEAKGHQAEKEAKHRAAGGYGKSVVSIHEKPIGGIKNSPAYLKVLARCGGGSKLPHAKDRAGAPVKGGFPLSKYPVNVLVDGQRAPWLPDDWAQVIKNTGPGGVYIGWMSPEGKFHYHRNLQSSTQASVSGVEVTVGRPLTALDGINGIIRSVVASGVSAKGDQAFLRQCLTSAELRHVLPMDNFHFGVVSARRANSDRGIQDLMTVDAHFRIAGVRATWYVDAESLEDYRKLGLDAVVGGKLTPARNMILDVAAKKRKVAVEVSDDISKWVYYDVIKQDLRGQRDFTKANQALAGAKKFAITPLAAAQFMLAKMRSSPLKPKLAGVLPTGNATMTMGSDEYSTQHFILGDFFVADASLCRFDASMTLKEDYDYTCSHISKHGSVLRCNRIVLTVRHYANEGGAVDNRDAAGKRERENIEILQRKWPGVFKMNVKRPSEVLMNWGGHGKKENRPAKGSSARAKRGQWGSLGSKAGRAPPKTCKPSPRGLPSTIPLSAKLEIVADAAETVAYIAKRCKRCVGKTVGQCLGMPFQDANGNERRYGVQDLKYDIARGRLRVIRT